MTRVGRADPVDLQAIAALEKKNQHPTSVVQEVERKASNRQCRYEQLLIYLFVFLSSVVRAWFAAKMDATLQLRHPIPGPSLPTLRKHRAW